MENNVSLEILSAGTCNDGSLEMSSAGTSKSVQPAGEPQQDASFVTPTKKVGFVPPGDNTTPRRSPRVPKPKKFHDDGTPDNAFRRTPLDDSDCPDTAPSTPQTPKSKTTSTPRVFHGESEVDTPASPNLDAVCSNDSFVIPTSICKVLQVSPRNTPSKTRASGISGNTPSKNTPNKASEPLNKTGPSPYKSHRPKYLPKNIKLVKKKRLERNDFLEKVEQFDAQLVKLPSTIANPKRAVNPIPANDGDLMGTQTPLFVIFNPANFFSTYDEHSFDTYFDMNIAELVRFLKLKPHLASVKDYRALTLFLTVTSDLSLFNAMAPLVEDNLISGKYVLDWEDLKSILINLGLTKDFFEFDNAGYYGIDPPKSPKSCNFKILFMVVEYSFPSYQKKRLERLVKFLTDCLFDPILQTCQHDIALLLRKVVDHVLQNGVAPHELVPPLNHSHYSWICNRVIIQHLAPGPRLKPLARLMAYRTIHAILKVGDFEGSTMLSHIADLLADIHGIMEKTTVKDVYQLIAVCENLVATASSPFDDETKTFLEKLADFAEHMSLGYTYFENLYFTDTVTRLRTLSAINNF